MSLPHAEHSAVHEAAGGWPPAIMGLLRQSHGGRWSRQLRKWALLEKGMLRAQNRNLSVHQDSSACVASQDCLDPCHLEPVRASGAVITGSGATTAFDRLPERHSNTQCVLRLHHMLSQKGNDTPAFSPRSPDTFSL